MDLTVVNTCDQYLMQQIMCSNGKFQKSVHIYVRWPLRHCKKTPSQNKEKDGHVSCVIVPKISHMTTAVVCLQNSFAPNVLMKIVTNIQLRNQHIWDDLTFTGVRNTPTKIFPNITEVSNWQRLIPATSTSFPPAQCRTVATRISCLTWCNNSYLVAQ